MICSEDFYIIHFIYLGNISIYKLRRQVVRLSRSLHLDREGAILPRLVWVAPCTTRVLALD